eukprot:CAMPEP_0172521880 /NCGR_PEP_ID=MMETSP1066-20121228/292826_1 /TAXON_ID=671091 /ORGANISM="Coscinodiscus wailesii, Strain CCMP2513" /LENGTH=279 /DNA_ID=CAMNT_0013304843 /DNA_START=24 /DNA_END=863 /DNA_ORIENTATION=+
MHNMILKEESELRIAINNDNWCEAMHILDDPKNHHQVTETDWLDRKPLHEACMHHDTPLGLVRMLCSVSIGSVLEKDNEGSSPLHYAMIFSSDEIILALIESCPKAVSIKGNYGWTPLHLAIYWDRSIAVFEALLSADPSLVVAQHKHIDNPLHYFFQKWNLGLVDAFQALKYSVPIKSVLNHHVRDNGSIPKLCKIGEIYGKTILLISSAVYGTTQLSSDRRRFKALHTSVKLNYCPWSFISLIRRFHPEEVRIKDAKGNLPLHIAVSNKPYTKGKIV